MLRALRFAATFAAALTVMATAIAAEPSKEYIERLNAEARALTKRMEACTDMQCINEISPRIQAISNELLRAHGYGDQLKKAGASGESCDPYLPLPGSFEKCAAVTLQLSQFSRWRRFDRLPSGDPGEQRSFVTGDVTTEYETRDEGYLAYNEDLQRFFIFVEGDPKNVKVSRVDGIWRSTDLYGNIESRRYHGQTSVRSAPIFQIRYPLQSGSDMGTNILLTVTRIDTTDPHLPGFRGNDIRTWAFETGQRLDFTPEVLRQALAKGEYRRTLKWEGAQGDPGEMRENIIELALRFKKPPDPGRMVVSPGAPYVASRSGPDKPFNPPSASYTVKNSGGKPITVKISNSARWLRLGATGGDLAPGASLSVILQPDKAAKALREGKHSDEVNFANLTNASGDTARRVQVETEPEKRIYDVALTGERVLEHRLLYGLLDPETGASDAIRYQHGVTFRYDLAVRVVLERHKGAWQYGSGKITKSVMRYVYRQSPEFYEVRKQSCSNCDRVRALAGKSINGSSDGSTLRLKWPNIYPRVDMSTKLTRDCAPGPRRAQCESDKKQGTTFAGTDDDFFARAAGHEISLSKQRTPFYKENRPGAALYAIRHTYTVKRIK